MKVVVCDIIDKNIEEIAGCCVETDFFHKFEVEIFTINSVPNLL